MTAGDALIGAAGFVGSNLDAQHEFAARFTSSNSGQARGGTFRRVYFSAARAEKWRINQEPEKDRAHIDELIGLIRSVSTERFVLISTVDVYPEPVGVDEWTEVSGQEGHTYGRHRRELELAVRAAHPSALIVRLPGLFGDGLKKNVIYDLLHDNNVDRLHPSSEFQYYDLAHLDADIELALERGLELVNLTSEPVRTGRIANECFGVELADRDDAAGRYDVRSRYADLVGGRDGYWRDADTVMRDLHRFVQRAGEAS